MTEEQWKAIETNDSSYDGKFCYALRTTHICCRPSCPVRACNPNNVIIFANAEEAMANGYRPCLRCHPELAEWKGAKNELAERAKKLIEKHYMDKFSLDEIAGKLFVNKSYLVRAFRETQDITPLHYHKLRAKNRDRRRAAAAAIVCFAGMLCVFTVIRSYNHREVTLSAPEEYQMNEDKTQILISVEAVSDGHLHRFEYTAPSGKEIRWIIVKKPNSASFGIGLDACDVCGTAGYYERKGTVVCKRCDVVMNINTIGFKGGCNPIPINYRIENGQIIFEMEDILASESSF